MFYIRICYQNYEIYFKVNLPKNLFLTINLVFKSSRFPTVGCLWQFYTNTSFLSFQAFVEIFQQNKNWFEASNECVNRGGNLAHPNELYLRNCSHKSINVWVDTNNQERLTPWIANMGNVTISIVLSIIK